MIYTATHSAELTLPLNEPTTFSDRNVPRQTVHPVYSHSRPQRLVSLRHCPQSGDSYRFSLHPSYTDRDLRPVSYFLLSAYRKVAYVLEELGLSYHSIYLDFSKGEHKAPEHTNFNPNGRIPSLVDHQNGDLAIWESNAILLYLVEKYDPEKRLTVTDEKGRHEIDQWLFFQASGQGCVPRALALPSRRVASLGLAVPVSLTPFSFCICI